jgi:hypothetical protein
MFASRALVKRELLTSLRRTRIMVWLVLLIMSCIAVVWLSWPDAVSNPRIVARSMEEILTGLSMVLLGGCILFIPSMAAGAIVSEREQDTLELLRMSLIRSSSIVFGKLLNAMGMFVLLVIAAAPAISTTLFGVGLEVQAIFYVFITLATVALTCALAGLASSAFFRKTILAVGGAYVLAALALSLPYILTGSITAIVIYNLEYSPSVGQFMLNPSNAWFGSGSGQFIDMIRDGQFLGLASPLSAVWVILDRGWVSGVWIMLSILLQAPSWALFAWLTVRWLHKRNPHAVIENEKPIDDLEVLKERREQFPYYLVDPLKRKKPIEDSRNPMFVREVRWGLFTRMTTLMRLCLAVFAMFFIASLFPVLYDNRETDSEIIVQWAAVQYLVTMLFAPALVANSFTKEVELGNMDMMRMTLMKPRQILAGKASAGLVVLSPVIIAVLVASIPLLFVGVRALPVLAASVATGLVWAGFCVVISLTISLFVKRTISALIVSYGIVAFTYLVLNTFLDFLWPRTQTARFVYDGNSERYLNPPEWVIGLRTLNPTTAVLSSEMGGYWFVNTMVSITVIVTCYAVSAFVLSRYRMQDS